MRLNYRTLLFCMLVPIGVIANEKETISVKIRRGEELSQIVEKLEKEGVIQYPFWFKMWAKITMNDRKIKAGYYVFKKPSGIREALGILTKGKSMDIKITIPEGSTLDEIASLLEERADIDGEEFIQLAKDSSYIKNLGRRGLQLNVPTLEGYLFPETYLISYMEEPGAIIERLVSQFFSIISDESGGSHLPTLKQGIEKSGYTLEEIVTLASLIEKEAIVDSEKPIISSVYHNRLRRGMLLQCDPTIQYILPKHKARLTYSDLKIESPYNTYIHKGLPPGPICSAGKSSILAAVYPAKSSYLYFVSEGKTHIFSRTNEEHMAAKIRAKLLRD